MLKNPERLTDEEIDAALAKEYPPEDFDVRWWWDYPEEKIGFCVSVAAKFSVSAKDFEANLYESLK